MLVVFMSPCMYCTTRSPGGTGTVGLPPVPVAPELEPPGEPPPLDMLAPPELDVPALDDAVPPEDAPPEEDDDEPPVGMLVELPAPLPRSPPFGDAPPDAPPPTAETSPPAPGSTP